MNKWIKVDENPPKIGQSIIAKDRNCFLFYSLVLTEDGWYFNFPDKTLNYRANVDPELWIPAPEY